MALEDAERRKERERIVMKSEERRALVLLGITAVLASLFATMEALIWSGAKKLEDFSFNFPANSPISHVTIFDVPLLQALITNWMFYAIFAFMYFSEDWFQGKVGSVFRTVCHAAASILTGFYIIFVLWYIPVFYVSLVWIPDFLQIPYTIAVGISFVLLEVRFLEMALDEKGLLKRVGKFYRGIAESIRDIIARTASWFAEKFRDWTRRRSGNKG